MTSTPRDALSFPSSSRPFLEPHLPPVGSTGASSSPPSTTQSLPFTTLTFATSLDSQLSLSPGVRTVLSGPQSKAMTHYLRSRHDAILVGVGTAVADDPGLNCRIEGTGGYGREGLHGQPRPVVLDPSARWDLSKQSKVLELAREGKGRAPFVLVARGAKLEEGRREVLEGTGGKYIVVSGGEGWERSSTLEWRDILRALSAEGLRSVMIEGGGAVINSLLQPGNFELINSVIVTIAPTWLGVGGVVVSPPRRLDAQGSPMAAAKLHDVKWHPFGEDVVMCGKLLP